MSAVQADSDPLALPPNRHAGAEHIDASAYLLTRYTWIPKSGPETVFYKHIAVANAAGFHFHTDLRGAWFRDAAFH
jgi:hypothetical protein